MTPDKQQHPHTPDDDIATAASDAAPWGFIEQKNNNTQPFAPAAESQTVLAGVNAQESVPTTTYTRLPEKELMPSPPPPPTLPPPLPPPPAG